MATIKNIVIAAATITALGAATLPAAQAHDRGGRVVAGLVIGAVVGGLLASAAVHAHPQPLIVAPPPPPRVVYEPVVVYEQRPVYERRPVVVYGPAYGYPQREWHGEWREPYRRPQVSRS